MHRPRLQNPVWYAAALAAAACIGSAQTRQSSTSAGYKAAPVPESKSELPYRSRPVPTVRRLLPFGEDDGAAAMSHFISYRTEAEMSADDRALAARMVPAIRAAAQQEEIEFDGRKWSYRQLECQAVPEHLLLLFETEGGTRNASLFSVAIERGGQGRVRVIPVQRRGYTPYTPAPSNALAIAEFNHMRAEEPKAAPADWMATSLCYAALTEPQATTALQPATGDANPALSFPPTLEAEADGISTVQFVDFAAPQRPMQWTISYDAAGQLLRTLHEPMPLFATRILP